MADTEKKHPEDGREPQSEPQSLEENFTELDEILSKMDDRDLSLEESFRLYQRGIQVLKQANESIDRVEKEVLKINADGSLAPLDQKED